MQISLIYKTTSDLYESSDFVDELSPFENELNRLRQYIQGEIHLSFDTEQTIVLDLYADFLIAYPEINASVIAADFQKTDQLKTIWFCEQGSDFYLDYEILGNNIEITYRPTTKTGCPNCNLPRCSYMISCDIYVKEWKKIFNKLDLLSKIYRRR